MTQLQTHNSEFHDPYTDAEGTILSSLDADKISICTNINNKCKDLQNKLENSKKNPETVDIQKFADYMKKRLIQRKRFFVQVPILWDVGSSGAGKSMAMAGLI